MIYKIYSYFHRCNDKKVIMKYMNIRAHHVVDSKRDDMNGNWLRKR